GRIDRGGVGGVADFVSLHRQHCVRARIVARHVAVGHAQHVECQTHREVLGRIAAEPADYQVFGLDQVGGHPDAGLYVSSHEMDAAAWDHGDEFVSAEVDAEALGVGNKALGHGGQVAQHCAVFWRHFAEELGADQAGGAAHVLNDDVWVALDVATDVPREYAGLDVGRAAHIVVDE